MQILVASWAASGAGRRCPEVAKARRQLTPTQQAVVARVRCSVARWGRLASGCASGGIKLDALLQLLEEEGSQAALAEVEHPRPDVVHVALVSSRIKFGVQEAKFDPLPYYEFFTAATYLEPDILRRRVPMAVAPFPRQRDVAEVILLAKRWDRVGRLRLFDPAQVPVRRRSVLTAVHKSEQWDRMTLDRRGPNSEEARLRRASQQLAPGWTLCDFVLAEHEELRLYSTDLCEMFFAFEVSMARGATNCIAAEVAWDEVSEAAAAEEFRRRRGEAAPRPRVLLSLFAEPMGDGNAVDYAQEAHGRLLEEAGCWSPAQRLEGRLPFPRGRRLELLTVDDHCGVVAVQRGARGPHEDHNWASMEETFARSLRQYEATPGVQANAEKTVWGASQGVILGASIDGVTGHVESAPAKCRVLVQATLAAVRAGGLRVAQMRQLLGQWTYASCFARSALALLEEAYVAVVGHTSESARFDLLEAAKDELLAVACCAPLLHGQMRAPVEPMLLCSDASPTGGGLARAALPRGVASELWRRRAVRGGHTRLATPYEAYCIEKGEDEAAAPAAGLYQPRASLRVEFEFMEVCTGREASVTAAMARAGLVVGPAVDCRRHPFWDILRDEVFSWLLDVVRAGRVEFLHVAPPCTTFSVARRPPVRRRLQPHGRGEEARHGTRLFLRCLLLLRLQARAGKAGTLEHPHSSLAKFLPVMKGALNSWLKRGTLSMCEYGTPWTERHGPLLRARRLPVAVDAALPRGASPCAARGVARG